MSFFSLSYIHFIAISGNFVLPRKYSKIVGTLSVQAFAPFPWNFQMFLSVNCMGCRIQRIYRLPKPKFDRNRWLCLNDAPQLELCNQRISNESFAESTHPSWNVYENVVLIVWYFGASTDLGIFTVDQHLLWLHPTQEYGFSAKSRVPSIEVVVGQY